MNKYVLRGVGEVSRHMIDPRLLQKYNIAIRRLPSAKITREHIEDTFGVDDYDLFIKGDEAVVCMNVSDDYAKYLFEVLNGKVVEVDGMWYPIEILYMENRIRMRRTEPIVLQDVRVPCERSCVATMFVCILWMIWLYMYGKAHGHFDL
jgi:hypothetical protein